MTKLNLDLRATRRHDAVWSFGGGIGDASMLQRKDVRRQLLMCRNDLGFRHVACGGIFGREMGVIRADGSFSFDRIEPMLDWLLESGLVPFLRLSPPPDSADAMRWRDLVKALATHIDGRYGCDAREWYFEIDQPARGDAPADATADDFADFDTIARAIKDIHPEYRVGWHASGGVEPVDRFLARVAIDAEGTDLPQCDFLTIGGLGTRCLDPAAVRQKLSAACGEATPLIVIGSDEDAAGERAFARDGLSRAAYVARTAVDLLGVCQGIITCNISDIEPRPATGWAGGEPFHNGRGLVTVNDIPKGAFNALRLLHEHGGYHSERLSSHWTDAPPGLGCLPTRSENTLRLLFWLDQPSITAGATRFTIEGIPESVSEAHIEVIRPAAGSAFEAWIKLDKPQFVNRDVLDALESASVPAQADVNFREYPPRLEPGMVMQLTMNLPYDEVE